MPKPGMQLYVTVSVDGKVVRRRRVCRSYVKNMVIALWCQMGQQTQNTTNTDGTSGTLNSGSTLFDVAGTIDTSTIGPRIGTGTTAVASTDTKLVTEIVTGSGSGQMRHLATTFNNLINDSAGNAFQVIRPFVNNSGASITVNECGMYCPGTAGGKYLCIVRDLISGGVAVAAGKTLTITYDVRINI